MITFDEPTSKSVQTNESFPQILIFSVDYRLTKIAKLLLHQIGSNWAQNLMYRSSWYIITQKGIDGYTPYENVILI